MLYLTMAVVGVLLLILRILLLILHAAVVFGGGSHLKNHVATTERLFMWTCFSDACPFRLGVCEACKLFSVMAAFRIPK